MVTPVVLIAACASLVLATTQRLGRTLERVRRVAADLGQAERDAGASASGDGYVAMLRDQLAMGAHRESSIRTATG